MSIIDSALKANREYSKRHDRKLALRPAPKIAVVTCMDPRLSNLPDILGLPHADIDVIRTGGPAVTEDVLAELVVSTRVLGTTEIMLLNHTGCGFTTFTDDELNAKLTASTGNASPSADAFLLLQGPHAEHARTDQEGEVTSLDRKRRPRAGLHLRHGDGAPHRSRRDDGAACRLRFVGQPLPRGDSGDAKPGDAGVDRRLQGPTEGQRRPSDAVARGAPGCVRPRGPPSFGA